jgi:hypothetical protein
MRTTEQEAQAMAPRRRDRERGPRDERPFAATQSAPPPPAASQPASSQPAPSQGGQA